jgi:hypothetical protein
MREEPSSVINKREQQCMLEECYAILYMLGFSHVCMLRERERERERERIFSKA